MTGKAGVWIDHRRAVVVSLTSEGEHIATIASNVEKHPERGGDSPLEGKYEARQVPADDSRQRALTGELNHFYESVIAAVHEFQNVLLFGPGEAKGELQKRLIKMKLGALVTAVETDDKMTEPQIVAKVREHFGIPSPRR
jgi:hypothetical protein